jgi:predicted nuclease of predicted toxin-antitoxin system
VRLFADLNIAPRTVQALRSEGVDVTRVNEVLPPSTSDEEIVRHARANGFTIVTQALDFSAIVALSGASTPSVVSLRLGSAQADVVSRRLGAILPVIRAELESGAIVTVEEHVCRTRKLPIDS